jgi:nitronate monooxygenase
MYGWTGGPNRKNIMASPSAAATRLLSRMRLPVIGAPLFIISNPKLVVAQCTSGVIGSFPALNARPKEKLDDWLVEIKAGIAAHDALNPERPSAPFAVNQIVHRSNDRLMHDMEVIVKHEVPLVITSLGAREDVNAAVHSYGGLVMHDVTNNFHAKKAIAKGADGLIAVCAGAGGHAGTISPFALMQEIREWWDGPLALSGAIATGRAVLSAQAAGADFAYMGSSFIATEEANATEAYKQAIVEADSSQIVYSSLFTGVKGNYLRKSIELQGLDPDNMPDSSSDGSTTDFGSGGLGGSDKPQTKAWRDIWGCGQGIGTVRDVPSTAEAVNRLAREYADAASALSSRAVSAW